MRVRTFGDPALRRKAAPVSRVTASLKRLARAMAKTMQEYRGVGLAAPQVGVSSRLVVVDVGDGLHILVNPTITQADGSQVDWEGCLSYPGLLAEVERAQRVSVQATDLDGRPVWLEAEGFLARALQHEIDHLDGVVILDRARAVQTIEPDAAAEVGPEEASPARLRVAFMGTPEFAVPTLRAIADAGHQVVGVVTQPDRPAGRGRRSQPPAVKVAASQLGLPVWQGGRSEVRERLAGVLEAWDTDIAVVVAFGVILPAAVLRAPRLGCINLHASLLPAYRGAAPIQRAIMDGHEVTGVTVIQMDEGMDTGDILARREIPIQPEDTAGTLHDRLSLVGAQVVVQTLELLATGRARPTPQPAAASPVADRIRAQDEVIDWTRPAEELARQVRALNPRPGAHTVFRGHRLKLWTVEAGRPDRLAPGGHDLVPGSVVGTAGGDPVVATGQGGLVLREVQPAGKPRMSGSDLVNGYRIATGERLGP